MIFHKKPPNFNPRFEVASCILRCQSEILLLHRQDHKPEGNTWCLPAGKCDPQEEPVSAMIREVQEETGITLEQSQTNYAGKVYVIPT